MEQVLTAIKIEYLGKGKKVVELPIPFVQKCEKTGEVICDPVGMFPPEDGLRLLEINGDAGMFREVERIYGDSAEAPADHPKNICQCGCESEIPWKKQHAKQPPKFIAGHNMTAKFKKTQSETAAPSPA